MCIRDSIEMAENLRNYEPAEVGSRGIVDTVRLLPRERSLIFMVSDFHMPISDLEESLVLMQRHHIVPIVLWDTSEYADLPEFGITSVTDPETVSYTHLDVYKRQAVQCSTPAILSRRIFLGMDTISFEK